MNRKVKRSRLMFAIISVLAGPGCGGLAQPGERGPSGRAEVNSDPEEVDAPLVQHVVPPKATDPAIDQALDDHYVWFNPASHEKHRLFVFMPGAKQRPAMFQRVPKEAARVGYHSIGLMYPDGVEIKTVCAAKTDVGACLENARLETIDGVHRSAIVNVSPANCINNRLTKLLQYLARTHPEEGWSKFLKAGVPRWERIAPSGHSRGGQAAAMVAKLHLVARVVLFSSPGDVVGPRAAPWLSTHVTPSNRYYGLADDRDITGPYADQLIVWEELGMRAFGGLIAPETSAPPYGGTHTLVTDLPPQPVTLAHGVPSNDAICRCSATGLPCCGTPGVTSSRRMTTTTSTRGMSDLRRALPHPPQKPQRMSRRSARFDQRRAPGANLSDLRAARCPSNEVQD